MYIRKNHLTIGEDVEIYEIVSDGGGYVAWFGTGEELSGLLGTSDWECGDIVTVDGSAYCLSASL